MSNAPRYRQNPDQPGGLPARLRAARGGRLATDMAERAGWPLSKISKIEHGKQLPSAEDLQTWADLTDTGEADLRDWNTLLQAGLDARRDYAREVRAGQRQLQRSYNGIIERATEFRLYETTFFPRFLQLPDYTRAVLTESRQRHGGADDVEAAVAERQTSVAYLDDDRRRFELLLAEPVLGWRWQALSRDTHRAQLRHLLAAIGSRPHVRIGIVPLFRPITWAPQNGFQLLGDIGFMEHWIGEQQYVLTDELDRLNHVMDQLWETACEGEQARALVAAAIRRLEQSGD